MKQVVNWSASAVRCPAVHELVMERDGVSLALG